MATKFKVSFELDEQDAKYFRSLYRAAKKNAARLDPGEIIRDARKLVTEVRGSKKVPRFVTEAIAAIDEEGWTVQRQDRQVRLERLEREGPSSAPSASSE